MCTASRTGLPAYRSAVTRYVLFVSYGATTPKTTASSSASARPPRCLSDPPTHAAPRLRLQARQRWPRHTASAALPRPPEHSAYGPVHRNGARPLQGLLERLTLALGILVPPLPGAGKLGTTSASPSITLAFAPASRCASISLMISIERSICSSVIALTPPECSNFSSFGTSMAQTFK